VLQAASTAKLLIVGQAPGRKVHATGVPWNDASGDRLRAWLQIDRATFYDAARVAIVPMGLCYPGAAASGGDRPPRRECAPLWHARLLDALRDVRCTLLVGQYAQKHYLRAARKSTLTETVRTFAAYGPRFFPLPHPSWRSVAWMRQNPWFEERVLADLRAAVHALVQPSDVCAVPHSARRIGRIVEPAAVKD